MGWMWAVGAAWLLVGAVAALLIGRSIRIADRKSAERAADAPNFVVDRPPLTLLPKPPDTGPPSPAEQRPPSAGREAPTIPGLPVARPSLGRPPVPGSKRQRPPRRSSSG